MDKNSEHQVFIEWSSPYTTWTHLRNDWMANSDSLKGRVIVLLFRLASRIRRGTVLRWIGFPYLVFYRIMVEWILGVEIPPLTRVGKSFAVHHGQGIVVNNRAIIGDDCIIRQGVTLGNRVASDPYGCPVIGNRVSIGASALVLGRLSIGDDAVIGAGAVVTRDVPAGDVVVGNPARSIAEKR